MKLFKERLKTLGLSMLGVGAVLLFFCFVTLLVGGLVGLLALIHKNLPGVVFFGVITVYLIYQIGLFIKWLFIEPIQQSLKSK